MFGLSMTAVSSYVFVTEKNQRISWNMEADDGQWNASLALEKEPGVTWKSAMTFQSRRVDDCEIKSDEGEVTGATLFPSPQQSEKMSIGSEADHMKRSLMPVISRRRWRKSPAKQEIEDDYRPFSVSKNGTGRQLEVNSSCELNSPLKTSPTIEQKSSPKLWGTFLCMGPPPQTGRPLSARPNLAVCSPLCDGSTSTLPMTKPLSPRLLKRKRLWGSDDRGRKNKRKVMCVSMLEQSVYDAAVTITMISVSTPPFTSKKNSSPVEHLETVPHTLQLALPPPPFCLWQTNT